MSENKYLQECERQAIETLCLQAVKACLDENLNREEMTGVYKFLLSIMKNKI